MYHRRTSPNTGSAPRGHRNELVLCALCARALRHDTTPRLGTANRFRPAPLRLEHVTYTHIAHRAIQNNHDTQCKRNPPGKIYHRGFQLHHDTIGLYECVCMCSRVCSQRSAPPRVSPQYTAMHSKCQANYLACQRCVRAVRGTQSRRSCVRVSRVCVCPSLACVCRRTIAARLVRS